MMDERLDENKGENEKKKDRKETLERGVWTCAM